MANAGSASMEHGGVAGWMTLVLSFLIVLVVIPVLLPVMLIFRIYRAILRELIRKEFGDKFIMASGPDSFWLQDKPENRGNINCLLKLEGKADVEKYKKMFSDRLILRKDPKNPGKKLFPKLTSYARKIFHRHVWVPEHRFDIGEHVYAHPGPYPATKTDVERLMSELCSAPLPVNKSPWQFIVVAPDESGPDYGRRHYALFRVHHSIGDGIALVRVFHGYVADEPPPDGTRERFGTKQLPSRAFRAALEAPSLLLSRLTRPADANILHGARLSGRKAISWSEPVDLDLIKRMKNATGSTVNDVLSSCLASAFRKYFVRRATVIPRDILSYIPVDVRPSGADVRLDNEFALVFLDLPMDEDDPVAVLRETKSRMDRIKASPEPVVNALTIKYCMNRLPNWMTELAFDWAAAKSTLVLSNVPGPQQKIRLTSNVVESMVFWPPQRTNVALSVSIFSYSGSVTVGIIVDCKVMSNPRILADQFVLEVKRLAKALSL